MRQDSGVYGSEKRRANLRVTRGYFHGLDV